MQIHVYSGNLTQLQAELLVVSCFEDIRPLKGLASEVDWIYGGALSRILIQGRFFGQFGERLLFAAEGKLQIPKIILIGLGKSTCYRYDQIQSISNVVRQTINGLNVFECAIEIDPPADRKLDTVRLVESFLDGWPLKNRTGPLELKFIVKDREKASVLQKIRTWVPGWKIQGTDIQEKELRIVHGSL